mgnify:CR=1 FL=1
MDAIRVEFLGDGAAGLARRILRKYRPDDFGLMRVDLSHSTNGLSVGIELPADIKSIGEAACRSAFTDASFKTTVGFLSEVLEEQRVHRALEADMQFVNLSL